MYVRLIRGRVCYIFFLILKYIWYLCISDKSVTKMTDWSPMEPKHCVDDVFVLGKVYLVFFSAPE